MSLPRSILTLIGIAVLGACSAKGSRSSASLPIRTNIQLRLERVGTHDFLAEYDRYLLLDVAGVTRAKIQISSDTGGYSRANIFFRAADSVFLVQDRTGRYEVDATRQSIVEAADGCGVPTNTVFVGAFDVDESNRWRFISATERHMMPMSISGCKSETQQIVGRERRERVSHHDWSGDA
ncbi:MAG TPA: hypothetical protein VGJ69_03695 [Pyrinomonadaceae bacterium]|jgi:hypothetical protein